MSRFVLTAAAEAVLAPVAPLLAAAAAALPGDRPLTVDVGEVEGFGAFADGRWLLSGGLAGPDLHHPAETGDMDRWRRAMGTALEGLAWDVLATTCGLPRDRGGWWQGAAVALAHRAAPELGLWEDAARQALRTGSLAERRAALLFAGEDPLEQAREWARGVDPARVRDRLEAALRPEVRARLGVSLLPPVALPVVLPSWSFARVTAAGAGGRVVGEDGVARVVGAEPTLVVRVEAGTVEVEPPEVVGAWDVASTEVPGSILGARGVTFRLYGSGRVDLLFADAFVGPIEALEIARSMGHSGMTSGTWRQLGPRRIRFDGFRAAPITMHQRDGSQALPQVGFGVTEWVAAMAGSEWEVDRRDGELFLSGRLMQMPVRLRLVPERG